MKMCKNRIIHAITYIWLIFMLLYGCQDSHQVRVLKGAHNFDQTHSVAKAYDFIAEYLADISGATELEVIRYAA